MSGSVSEAAGSVRWRKPGRLYEEIARDLAEGVVGGDPASGEFLPTEQVLVERYGASRNIVREAVKLLNARGLIETIHGRGSVALPPERWRAADQLVRLVREDPRVPENLLELRRILEVEFAGLAALRAEPRHLEAMRETVERMRAAPGDQGEGMDQDVRFHRLLAEATNNSLLPMLLEPVDPLLRANRLATIANPGTMERSIAAHETILERVEAGDEPGAREAMREHLEQVESEVRRIQD